MIKNAYFIYRRLTSDKKFLLSFILQLSICIFILSFTLSFFNNFVTYTNFYNEDLENSSLLYLSNQINIEEIKDNNDFAALGYTCTTKLRDRRNSQGKAIITSILSSEMNRIKIPLYKGRGFQENKDYFEAIVSKSLKNTYKINNVYDFYGINDKNMKIKIIGYLPDNNISPSFWGNGFKYLFNNEASIILCGDDVFEFLEITQITTFAIVFDNTDINYMKEKYLQIGNFYLVKDLYKDYIKFARQDLSTYIMLSGIVISIIFVGLSSSLLLKLDKNKKETAINLLYGQKSLNLYFSQIITMSVYLIIAIIINLFIIIIQNIIMLTPYIQFKNLITSVMIITLLFIFITLYTNVKIILVRPINVLRGEL